MKTNRVKMIELKIARYLKGKKSEKANDLKVLLSRLKIQSHKRAELQIPIPTH